MGERLKRMLVCWALIGSLAVLLWALWAAGLTGTPLAQFRALEERVTALEESDG